MARTAVVAGTATATVNAVNSAMGGGAQRQQAQVDQLQAQMAASQAQQAQADIAAQQAQVAAQPAAAPAGITDETLAQLQKLGDLKQAGVLTDEEFTAAKAKLLGL
jgi:hypothetical protein